MNTHIWNNIKVSHGNESASYRHKMCNV